MKFEAYRIAPEIKRNLEAMGIVRPTDIQFKAISPILKGEDVLAIQILHLIKKEKKRRRSQGISCVVMVPTRELALQITGVFEQIGKGLKIKTLALFGGVDQDPQIARLTKGVDVLVTTPGRMFDLVSQGHLELGQAGILVLDEADRMLDLGFIKDIRDAIRFLPRQRQTLFFSATIDDNIKKLAYSLVGQGAIRIQVSPKDPVSKNVMHSVAFVEMDDKRFFLARLLEENPEDKVIVFVRTKVRAERVVKALERANFPSVSIHGDKDQKERIEALNQFRNNTVRVLIATDVSARGIDIPGIDIVVNYDLPDDPENYVHRVGRTGRGTQKGRAVAFCSTEEKPLLKAIEEYITKPVKVLDIEKTDYQETLDLHEDRPDKWKDIMSEIADAEKWMKKKKRK
jgi:ATP-dependent RNA helicase RhlE